MKRIISVLLSVIILASAFTVFVNGKDERTGITLERTSTNGTSHPVGYYETGKRYEKMPVTFEAWVYIPKSVYSQRGGIIIGNYQSFSKDVFINFEIHQNGIPRLLIDDPSGTMHDYKFASAAVPADTWAHVAIVYGTGTDGKQIYCYVNGEFKQASDVANWYEAPTTVLDNTLCLGGDYRALNEQGFRGELGDVWVYSDIRNAREIFNDYKKGADLSDSELILYYELFGAKSAADVPDKSGNGYDMSYYRFWLTEEEMEAIRAEDGYEYEYVLAFLPDMQYMTQDNTKKLRLTFDWLVNQGKQKNIKYILTLGDMTNANSPKEWITIIRQTDRLNGYIPYSLVPGNHDVISNNRLELFNNAYAKKTGYYYQHVAANGGFFKEESVRSTYLTFSVGKIDYIIINLDFGATDDILEWAGGVLESHPEHRAIITTHGYLNADGTTLDSNDYASPDAYDKALNSGEDIWEKFISKYENIDMIVSGHMHHDPIVVTPREGDAGNTVYQILMDPQSTCKKLAGLGAVGLMYFTADGNRARVEYYSTVFDKYFCESNKNISLIFGESEAEVTTSAEETTESVTDAPKEPLTSSPTDEKGGCGATVAVTTAVTVILGVPLFIKRKETVV